MARYFSGTVKEIVGTAQSVGCTVDGAAPHENIDAINNGQNSCSSQLCHGLCFDLFNSICVFRMSRSTQVDYLLQFV
jgi:hypothetical protein